ncbi:hypothetical protein [Ethanoligenens sp.]|uniref:hypothetical protein n=1 Tax=Ethanoligenens sp. TaxID=2099655 RepID=UPI0039E9373A
MIQRDLNLLSAYQNPTGRRNSIKRIAVLVLGASLLAVLGTFCYLNISSHFMKMGIRSGNAYLATNNVKNAQAAWDKATQEIAVLRQYGATAQTQIQKFGQMPAYTSAMFTEVAKSAPANLTVQIINLSNQTLMLTCVSTDQLAFSSFVNSLKSNNMFSSVSYDIVSSDAANGYMSVITCTVQGGS